MSAPQSPGGLTAKQKKDKKKNKKKGLKKLKFWKGSGDDDEVEVGYCPNVIELGYSDEEKEEETHEGSGDSEPEVEEGGSASEGDSLGASSFNISVKTKFSEDARDLFVAVKKNQLKRVKYLIARAQKPALLVDTVDEILRTPLFFAAGEGYLKIMKELIEAGANVTLRSEPGLTPLHEACYEGGEAAYRAVQILLRKGADPSQRDNEGFSPFHYAVQQNELGIAKLLLLHDDEGRFQAASLKDPTGDGDMPLHLAAKAGLVKMCDFILANDSVDPEAREKFYMRSTDGRSPLHVAAEAAHPAVVLLLMKAGFRPTTPDSEGYTPLHRAVQWDAWSNADYQLVLKHMLLMSKQSRKSDQDFGYDPKFLANHPNAAGSTPLHLVSSTNNFMLFKLIIAAGADLDSLDSHMQTPLHIALQGSSSKHFRMADMVKFLLSKGAVPYRNDERGITPLHLACLSGLEMVRIIIPYLSEEDKLDTDYFGRSAMHFAAKTGSVELVDLLIKMGLDAEEDDYEGMTALHIAAQEGHITLCHHLIEEEDVSVNQLSNSGDSPLHLAVASGHEDVAIELYKLGGHALSINRDGRVPVYIAASNNLEEAFRFMMTYGAYYGSKEFDPIHPFTMLPASKGSGESPLVLLLDDAPPVFTDIAMGLFNRDVIIRADVNVNLYDFGLTQEGYKFMTGPKGRNALIHILNSGSKAVFSTDAFKAMSEILWLGYAQRHVQFHVVIYWALVLSFSIASYFHNSELQIQVMLVGSLLALLHLFFEFREFRRSLTTDTSSIDYDWLRMLARYRPYTVKMTEWLIQNLLPRSVPEYMRDFWNILDLGTYVLCLVSTALYIAKSPHGVYALAITILSLWIKTLQDAAAFRPTSSIVRVVGKMIINLVQIMGVAGVFMLGFGQALFLIYDSAGGEVSGYGSLTETIVTLFRAMLGDADYDSVQGAEDVLAAFLWGIYWTMGSVLLLNLLIAMMTTSYELIREEAETEFLIARARAIYKVLPRDKDMKEEHKLRSQEGEHTAVAKRKPGRLQNMVVDLLFNGYRSYPGKIHTLSLQDWAVPAVTEATDTETTSAAQENMNFLKKFKENTDRHLRQAAKEMEKQKAAILTIEATIKSAMMNIQDHMPAAKIKKAKKSKSSDTAAAGMGAGYVNVGDDDDSD